MKKIGIMFVIVIALFSNVKFCFAQEVPADLAHLQSIADFRSWAAANIRSGIAYVSGDFLPTNTASEYVYYSTAGNMSAYEEVLSALRQQQISFKPLDPKDNGWVTSVISLQDKYGHMRFVGFNDWQLQQGDDGDWSAPANAGQIELQLYRYQPINVGSQAQNVQMIRKDKGGQYIGWEYLDVYDGVIWFNLEWCDGGILVVQHPGGAVAYDLQNRGQQVDASVIGLYMTGDMSGIVTNVSENVGLYTLVPESTTDRHSAKVIKVEVTSSRYIYFSGQTTKGEWAESLTVRSGTDGSVLQEVNMPAGRYVPVLFSPGTHFISMRWENGFDETL